MMVLAVPKSIERSLENMPRRVFNIRMIAGKGAEKSASLTTHPMSGKARVFSRYQGVKCPSRLFPAASPGQAVPHRRQSRTPAAARLGPARARMEEHAPAPAAGPEAKPARIAGPPTPAFEGTPCRH